MATTLKVNADDQHIESMNELARKFFGQASPAVARRQP
jgi:hypothetical protein